MKMRLKNILLRKLRNKNGKYAEKENWKQEEIWKKN